jgi:hypothetical protein
MIGGAQESLAASLSLVAGDSGDLAGVAIGFSQTGLYQTDDFICAGGR